MKEEMKRRKKKQWGRRIIIMSLVMRKSYEWENCVYHEVKVANCDYVMNGIV